MQGMGGTRNGTGKRLPQYWIIERDPSRPSLPYTTAAAKTQLYSPTRSVWVCVCVCVFWNIDRIWRCSDVTYGLNQRFKNTTKPFCITVFGNFFPFLEAEHISLEFLQPSQRNINHLHSLHLATLSNVNWRAWERQESSFDFPVLWILCRMCGYASKSQGSGCWSKLVFGWARGLELGAAGNQGGSSSLLSFLHPCVFWGNKSWSLKNY